MPERCIPTKPNVLSPLCCDPKANRQLDMTQLISSRAEVNDTLLDEEREEHGNGD